MLSLALGQTATRTRGQWRARVTRLPIGSYQACLEETGNPANRPYNRTFKVEATAFRKADEQIESASLLVSVLATNQTATPWTLLRAETEAELPDCPTCNGTGGGTWTPGPCEMCDGSGKIGEIAGAPPEAAD